METKNKLLILSLSFAVFIVGVRALYSEPGVVRNGVLAASVMGLVAIAVVQTVRAVKRNKKLLRLMPLSGRFYSKHPL